MDMLTVIVSAIGGIFLWNIFFSGKKSTNICEAATKASTKNLTNMAPFNAYKVACRLQEQFGTTDLNAMFEYFANKKTPIDNSFVNMAPFDPYKVACRLQEQLGTTDLNAVFEYFANKETKKQLENNIFQR